MTALLLFSFFFRWLNRDELVGFSIHLSFGDQYIKIDVFLLEKIL